MFICIYNILCIYRERNIVQSRRVPVGCQAASCCRFFIADSLAAGSACCFCALVTLCLGLSFCLRLGTLATGLSRLGSCWVALGELFWPGSSFCWLFWGTLAGLFWPGSFFCSLFWGTLAGLFRLGSSFCCRCWGTLGLFWLGSSFCCGFWGTLGLFWLGSSFCCRFWGTLGLFWLRSSFCSTLGLFSFLGVEAGVLAGLFLEVEAGVHAGLLHTALLGVVWPRFLGEAFGLRRGPRFPLFAGFGLGSLFCFLPFGLLGSSSSSLAGSGRGAGATCPGGVKVIVKTRLISCFFLFFASACSHVALALITVYIPRITTTSGLMRFYI